MAGEVGSVGAARGACPGDEAAQISIDAARKDDEVLVQLVESCLFMRGDAIAEGDIADTLGIPAVAVRRALQNLADRYVAYAGAIRVREIDDGLWLMDLHEDVSDHVDTFYIEDLPYTRSEVMTLAFIAFAQPVPRQVLAHFRGTNAGSQARKLVEAGLVKEEVIGSQDPRLRDVVENYKHDLAERLADVAEHHDRGGDGTRSTKTRGSWLDRAEYPCYATTNRFCGYFNLPRDLDSMKRELENWKEIYGLFH